MTWRDTFRTAAEAVRTHRLRSALTMLGILIGITAVILTVGLGNGAKAEVREQINELGTNLLVISPGSSTNSTGVRGGFGSSSTLTVGDAEALSSSDAAPDIEAVAPTSTTQISLTYGDTNWTTTLTGTTPSWTTIRSREVSSGRFLTEADQQDEAKVVVLGPDTATELFGQRSPIGQQVVYNGTALQVVGVLDGAELVRPDEQQRRGHRAALDVRRAPRRWQQPQRRRVDLREGDLGGHAVGGLPGGRHAAPEPPRHHDVGQRRLLDRDAGVAAVGRDLGRPDDDADARRHRRDLAARRWHRRHEHHARVGHRADP